MQTCLWYLDRAKQNIVHSWLVRLTSDLAAVCHLEALILIFISTTGHIQTWICQLFLFQLSGEFRECDLKPWKPSHKQQKMWSAFVTFSQVGQIQDSIPHLLKLISTCHGFIHAAHNNAFVFQNLEGNWARFLEVIRFISLRRCLWGVTVLVEKQLFSVLTAEYPAEKHRIKAILAAANSAQSRQDWEQALFLYTATNTYEGYLEATKIRKRLLKEM